MVILPKERNRYEKNWYSELIESYSHFPVLISRCIDLLTPPLTYFRKSGKNAILVDATLGAGGHSKEFLTHFPDLKVIGLDCDPYAIDVASTRLSAFKDRINIIRTHYDEITSKVSECGFHSVDGILFDLGVSSMQLDQPERGFSYSTSSPLDMRMDPDTTLTAAQILNKFDAKYIKDILYKFGQERFASQIADKIIKFRKKQPFINTSQLVDLIYKAVPAPARRTGGHPAKRTFQALRVAVNNELNSLQIALSSAINMLKCNGIVVVMTYQSLEAHIVKSEFLAATNSKMPFEFPTDITNNKPSFTILTKSIEYANQIEVNNNPRSNSVQLRALKRIS